MKHDDQPLRLNLELDPDPDTIRGAVGDRWGTRHCFWGWLELMSAVERMRSDDRYGEDQESGPVKGSGPRARSASPSLGAGDV
jgi:hypothetical protein